MLARTTGEAVWIGRLANGKIHIVHQAVRPGNLVQVLDRDSVLPWYACALGQAIVAALEINAQEALLALPAERLTGLTVTRLADLRQILVTTRRRGYAVEAHMATLGDAGIAAPMFDSSRRAVGAIGIVGPAERLLSAERQKALADAVCCAAERLSQEMGAGGMAETRPDPRSGARGPFAPGGAAVHDFQG
jgi:DNA-binding IclR family transcriptional regulator